MTTMDTPQDAQHAPDGATTGRPAAGSSSFGQTLRDYFVLTKPSIMLLLLITTLPAMVIAEAGWPGIGPVVVTLLGGMMAAGGAGAVNMYIDRDIDAVMVRTRKRPIPSGRVPARHALIFGATLGMAGTAGATMTTYSDGSMVATPDVHARQDLMSYWQRGRLPEPVPYRPGPGAFPERQTARPVSMDRVAGFAGDETG